MTRDRLMAIAAEHHLTLSVERITTGNADGGFHEFEFKGDADDLYAAAKAIRAEWPYANQDFVCVRRVNNPEHPMHGWAYLEVSSFWC